MTGPATVPPSVPSPPPARRDDIVDVVHGQAVPDPYRWLEADDDPEVRRWVAAQNDRTHRALGSLIDRSVWHERLVALAGLPTTIAIDLAGRRRFTLDRGAGHEQYVLRVTDIHGGPSRVLIDPAGLADDAAVALDWYKPSRDGTLVAFGLSHGGDERSVLHLLDVDSGKWLDDEIPDTRYCSIGWLPDGNSFRYTRLPPGAEYEPRVYEHRLGTDWHDDELIWGDLPTHETMTAVQVSPDGRWTVVSAWVGWSRIDVHIRDERDGTWRTAHVGLPAVTRVDFQSDRLLATTTLDAPMGRVVAIDPLDPVSERWTSLVHESDSVIESVVALSKGFIVVGSREASVRLVHHADDGEVIGEIALPEPMSVAGLEDAAGLAVGQADDGGDVVGALLMSFTRPPTLFHWRPGAAMKPWVAAGHADPAHGQPQVPYREPIAERADDGPNGDMSASVSAGDRWDPDDYVVRRVGYRSPDGTKVGMFVMHRRDVVASAETPCLLTGYGGFALSESPLFRPMFAAWCERGGVLAAANLRGGYEHGKPWHEAGCRANKQAVFDDFIAAADHLVEAEMASRDRLAIVGRSNGGLLVGATMTQRPDLCRAVVCGVPLLDMVRYPRFLIARLWTDEYGDPDVAEEFGWLYAYSPYHHVVDGTEYPATLFFTAESNSRVHPCHALKMTALVQHASAGQDERPILLRVESRAGHGVGKPASKQADEAADLLTFIAWQLALDAPPS